MRESLKIEPVRLSEFLTPHGPPQSKSLANPFFPKDIILQTTIFSDGLANIRMVDGVLRFELINITAQPAPDKLDVQSVGSVAMTLQGLVRTYNQLSGVMNQLTQQGLLKRSEPGEAQALSLIHISEPTRPY